MNRPIEKFVRHLPFGEANILPEKTSPQELINALAIRNEEGDDLIDPQTGKRFPHCGLIVAYEMGQFFSKEGFSAQMATQVTALNDAPMGERIFRFRNWSTTLYNPCVGMSAKITPSGIADELPPEAKTAGFFGRVLWVYEDQPNTVNALIDEIDPRKKAKVKAQTEWLRTDLERIAALRGEFTPTREFRAAFKAWYADHARLVARSAKDSGMAETGYLGRKDNHIIRAAMVIAASGGSTKSLAVGDFDRAKDLVERNEKDFELIMKDVGKRPDAFFEELCIRILAKYGTKDFGIGAGWVPRSKVMTAVWRKGNAIRLAQAEMTLVEGKIITTKTTGVTKPKVWWKLRVTDGRRLKALLIQQIGSEEHVPIDPEKED